MSIQVKVGNLDNLRPYLMDTSRKFSTSILASAETVASQAAKLAGDITHQGTTRRLHEGWVVQRSTNKVTLTNITPYALTEFRRGGNKVRGNPPLGSHNPVPRIIDMINANLEPAINRAVSTTSIR